MPVCYDGSQVEFNAPKKTGGTKTVTLDVNQIPPHSHVAPRYHWKQDGPDGLNWGSNNHVAHAGSSENTGGGQAHNNLPPYSVVYGWERIV